MTDVTLDGPTLTRGGAGGCPGSAPASVSTIQHASSGTSGSLSASSTVGWSQPASVSAPSSRRTGRRSPVSAICRASGRGPGVPLLARAAGSGARLPGVPDRPGPRAGSGRRRGPRAAPAPGRSGPRSRPRRAPGVTAPAARGHQSLAREQRQRGLLRTGRRGRRHLPAQRPVRGLAHRRDRGRVVVGGRPARTATAAPPPGPDAAASDRPGRSPGRTAPAPTSAARPGTGRPAGAQPSCTGSLVAGPRRPSVRSPVARSMSRTRP